MSGRAAGRPGKVGRFGTITILGYCLRTARIPFLRNGVKGRRHTLVTEMRRYEDSLDNKQRATLEMELPARSNLVGSRTHSIYLYVWPQL